MWGILFFIFMSFAALSTVIAVFENIISISIDMFGWKRKKSLIINLIGISVLSLPAVLGFNVLSGITPMGAGTNIMDLEDFLVSGNILPLGSLLFVLFCTRKNGWGFDKFVKEVDKDNVKVMLDTFHMNIEEVSIGDAIRHAGNLLGHLHTGECNRMVPGKGRMPWREIGDALQDIKYDGNVVMEPFVRMGGQVGSDIKIWRDISRGASEAELDADAKRSVEFQRYMLDWK